MSKFIHSFAMTLYAIYKVSQWEPLTGPMKVFQWGLSISDPMADFLRPWCSTLLLTGGILAFAGAQVYLFATVLWLAFVLWTLAFLSSSLSILFNILMYMRERREKKAKMTDEGWPRLY